MKPTKFYAVAVGRKTGVFRTWEETQAQTSGFSGAKFQSFPSEHGAKQYLAQYKNPDSEKNEQKIIVKSFPKGSYIAVDAAYDGRYTEWRCVLMPDNQLLFQSKGLDDGSNNVGEYVALYYGARINDLLNTKLPIYTDSVTAMAWARDGSHKSDAKLTGQLFILCAKANDYFTNNPKSHRVLKWQTSEWGEIPADFGRKKSKGLTRLTKSYWNPLFTHENKFEF